MGKTRRETDSLEELEVPCETHYGAQVLQSLNNFSISGISIGHLSQWIQARAIAKDAAVLADATFGDISASKARANCGRLRLFPAIYSCSGERRSSASQDVHHRDQRDCGTIPRISAGKQCRLSRVDPLTGNGRVMLLGHDQKVVISCGCRIQTAQARRN